MKSPPEKRSVLITGCSSGIGHCLALGLQRRGYHVIATCRDPRDRERLAQQGLAALELDLDSSVGIAAAVEQALELCSGNLYALVNNGAYGQPGAVEDLGRDALRAQFETNVFGAQELTNRVIPAMRAQGRGRIIQVSSVLGFVCLRYRGAYNASKYALEALSDTLRMELAGSGIRVSLVEPGPIESRFQENARRKFMDNIDREASAHARAYREVEARLSGGRQSSFTLPAEAVLKAVERALADPNPKIRYRVTTPTTVFAILKRLLPDRLMDRVLFNW